MKSLILFFALSSFGAYAAIDLECKTGDNQLIQLRAFDSDEIQATYKGETVNADGFISTDIVDLIARFTSIGEISILAKVGNSGPQNYIFIQGKRNSIICR